MATFNMMDLKEGDSWEIPGPKSAEETYGTNKYSKRCMVGALLVTIVCVAVVAGVVAYVTMSSSSLVPQTEPMPSPLKYFKTDDALEISWSHGCNSQADLERELEGDTMMLEADVIVRYQGLANETTVPIMAHPPDVDSDITLDQWLTTVLANYSQKRKGIKLDFKGFEALQPSLVILKSREKEMQRPLWINADIMRGPGGIAMPITREMVKRGLDLISAYLPRATQSLGWTTGCCSEIYTKEMVTDMWDTVKNIRAPVTFPVRAALARKSWPHLKWLLEKSEKFSLTIWTLKDSKDWEGTDVYDLLYIRNDCNKSRIYYDLPGPKLRTFKQLSVTAGSLFNFFPLQKRDGLNITWAHAANSKADMEKAIQSDIMMLEADCLLRGQGTANQTRVPIMAHPPLIDSDNTLESWLTEVVKTKKGIKLDFKSIDVISPALEILKSKQNEIRQPVWINSDIFIGPNCQSAVNATKFKEIVLKNYPECTLSIGWTTCYDGVDNSTKYTTEMVNEALEFSRDLKQPITFPVRAALVRRSWDALKTLLDKSSSYSLTIWTGKKDKLDPADMVFVRKNSNVDQIYYDLPDPLFSDFLKLLEEKK